MTVTNEADVGLPSLSERRRETWDYYRIEFLEDGYPGRRSDVGLHPHPIYGAYVINDFLGQHRLSGQSEFLEAACKVADAAVGRMTRVGDALVFYYQPGTGVSSLPDVFYSGLTQSRYLRVLGVLDKTLGGKSTYAGAASSVLHSLQIPASEEGVSRRTPNGGRLIEEYSHAVPDYTLNGWTTATELIHQYAGMTGDDEAYELFRESVHGIEGVLPLYDVPELANSRYRLTGPAKVRLVFSDPGATVTSASVTVPGQGDFALGERGGKWQNRFLSGVQPGGLVPKTQALMELQLCRVSWPHPNRLTFDVEAPATGSVRVEIQQGPYDPLANWIKGEDYAPIAEVDISIGTNRVDVPVPWRLAELAAYPTSWTKPIGGKQYNSYHFIHIDTLTKIAELSGSDMLDYYAHRWADYPSRWPSMPVYADAEIQLERYKAPPKS